MTEPMTETAIDPRLRDVLTLRDKALMQIATHALPGEDVSAELDAVHRLADLARRGLANIGPDDVRWSVLNDPYCAAAYHLGIEHYRRGMVGSRLTR